MSLNFKKFLFNLKSPQIMGILNLTPDSFFSKSRKKSIKDAIEHVDKMIKYGASIIDIGGVSTRPNSREINVEEELERVLPVLEAIVKRFNIYISIDTSNPEVIYETAKIGVHLINDVFALEKAGSLKALKKTNLHVCLVHMQGNPKNMQKNPQYKNLFLEMNKFFRKKICLCEKHGIKKENILLDPGFGFGKTTFHNYHLLANLYKLKKFNLPILVGLSRKSMIGNILKNSVEKRLIGSVIVGTIAMINGINIIRAHDVKETMQAIKIINTVNISKKWRK